MGAVHGRQVGAVLIAKLDRCTRSVADLASLIDTFSRRGVALISAAESLDTSSAGGRLVVNVLGAVAVGAGSHRPSARQQRCRCSSSRAAPPAGWRPTGSSSSPGAGHGTRASRKRLQRSSSTAPPASHGRRWPTSSAPPGTAPAPAAAGRARAPTKCTKRANASTAQQRKTAPPHRTGIAGPVFVAIRAGRGPGGRILTSGLPGAPGRFYHHQAPAGPQAARRLPKRARQRSLLRKVPRGG